MSKAHTLDQGLRIWKEEGRLPPPASRYPDGHIPMETLYRMAGSGGIDASDDAAVHHLSLCPDCLETWASWRQAVTAVEELDSNEAVDAETSQPVVYGLRQAAASFESREPFSLRSSCGKFVLGVLPQVDNPDRGLVTIEAAAEGEMPVEGRHFMVRDRNGRVVLQGRLHHGRLARTCERLNDLDLSAWTLLVDEKQL